MVFVVGKGHSDLKVYAILNTISLSVVMNISF